MPFYAIEQAAPHRINSYNSSGRQPADNARHFFMPDDRDRNAAYTLASREVNARAQTDGIHWNKTTNTPFRPDDSRQGLEIIINDQKVRAGEPFRVTVNALLPETVTKGDPLDAGFAGDVSVIDPSGAETVFTLSRGTVNASMTLEGLSGRVTFTSQAPRPPFPGYALINPPSVIVVEGDTDDETSPAVEHRVDVAASPQRTNEGEDVTITWQVLDPSTGAPLAYNGSLTLQESEEQGGTIYVSQNVANGQASYVVQRRAGIYKYATIPGVQVIENDFNASFSVAKVAAPIS